VEREFRLPQAGAGKATADPGVRFHFRAARLTRQQLLPICRVEYKMAVRSCGSVSEAGPDRRFFNAANDT